MQYGQAYGVEFVKMKMKQIESEACEEAGEEKQLMYREVRVNPDSNYSLCVSLNSGCLLQM